MEYLKNHFLYACQDFETIKKNYRAARLCISYFQGKFNTQILSPEYSQLIQSPAFFRYLLRYKITYFGCKKKKKKKERKKGKRKENASEKK